MDSRRADPAGKAGRISTAKNTKKAELKKQSPSRPLFSSFQHDEYMNLKKEFFQADVSPNGDPNPPGIVK
jgi:hypothetical protein